MAEVESVVKMLVREWLHPNIEQLGQADPVALAQLWKDFELSLKFSSAEILCTDFEVRPEVQGIQNDMRKVSLDGMQCLKALMRETASGRVTAHHPEMIKCAVSACTQLRGLVEEACDCVAPELLALFQQRLN